MIRYEQDPLRYAKKLTDPELGSYRFRIGDYRVVFDLIGEDIVILRVGHRSQIYKAWDRFQSLNTGANIRETGYGRFIVPIPEVQIIS